MSKFLENDDGVSLILPRTQQKYSSRVRARHLMAFGLMLQCLILAAETNLPLNATTQWVGFFFSLVTMTFTTTKLVAMNYNPEEVLSTI